MKGTLEFICGTSGTGKEKLLKERIRSYRVLDYNTRPPRDSEKIDLDGEPVDDKAIQERIGQTGMFESKEGIFLSKEKFQVRIDDPSEFFVWYQYEDGRRYGFGRELKGALERGELAVEQIGYYKCVDSIMYAFKSLGITVKKTLLLSSFEEIKKRLKNRGGSKEEIEKRIQLTKENLMGFLRDRLKYNRMAFIFPAVLHGEDSDKKLDELLATLEKGKLPDEIYDDLIGMTQFACSLRVNKTELIETLKARYKQIRGIGMDIVLNHFTHDINLNTEFNKLIYMYANANDRLPRFFLNPLGISFLLAELGESKESLNELINLEYEIHHAMETGDIKERNYRSLSVVALFKNAYLGFDDFLAKRSRGEPYVDDLVNFVSNYSELYNSVREFNNYFLIKKNHWVIQETMKKMRVIDLSRAIRINLGLEATLLGILETAYGKETPPMVSFKKKLVQDNIKFLKMFYDPKWDENPQLYHDWFLTFSEGFIFPSLSHQSHAYCNILNLYSQLSAKQTNLNSLTEYILNSITNYITLNRDFVPRIGFTAICFTQLNSFLNDMLDIYTKASKEKADPMNSFYPPLMVPQNFFRKYWLFNVPSYNKVEAEMMQVVKKISNLLSK